MKKEIEKRGISKSNLSPLNSAEVVLKSNEQRQPLNEADMEDKLQEICDKIKLHFEMEEPYLDAKFNMQSLAR